MSANISKQLSSESCFYTEKALQKTYWGLETSIANMMALSNCFEHVIF